MSDEAAGIVSSVGNPHGHVEWPATPGLPPVGELVQITFRQRADAAPITGMGYVEQIGDVCGWWCVWPPRATSGENCDLGWQVESWCRVLVVPDTDDTRERLAAALVGQRPEHWARSRQLAPKVAALTLQQAGRALAALREAAIR